MTKTTANPKLAKKIAKNPNKSTRISITLDDDLKAVLDAMKKTYPTLSYGDLMRMATGGYFTQVNTPNLPQTKVPHWQAWADTLPELKLSHEQMQELEESIASFDLDQNRTVYSSPTELMNALSTQKV